MNRGSAKCFLISGYPRNMRDVAEYLERVSDMISIQGEHTGVGHTSVDLKFRFTSKLVENFNSHLIYQLRIIVGQDLPLNILKYTC